MIHFRRKVHRVNVQGEDVFVPDDMVKVKSSSNIPGISGFTEVKWTAVVNKGDEVPVSKVVAAILEEQYQEYKRNG